MIIAWLELKEFLQAEIKENKFNGCVFYHIILIKTFELESKYACQSLKEAGY